MNERYFYSIIYFLLLVTSLLTLSCNNENAPDCLKSTGRTIQERRPISSFSEIVLYDNIDLYLTHSQDSVLIVEAGENLLPKILSTSAGNTLTIRNTNTCNWTRSYKRPIKVTVGVPHSDFILTHRGYGKVRSAEPLQISFLNIASFDAGGDVDLNGKFGYISIYCNSPAHITLSGQTDFMEAWLHNSIGRLSSEFLQTNVCNLKHDGSNEMRVFPLEEMQVEISANGTVAYYHQPAKLTSEIKNNGKLVRR